MKQRTLLWMMLAVIGLSGGCGSREPFRSTLDEQGLTWVSPHKAITLARPAPRFSAAARDYIYIAPVETNSMGTREHYLWIGLASTVDRAQRSLTPDAAVDLVLLLDGLPVELPLSVWGEGVSASLYDPPAPIHQVRQTRISLDQLQRIAQAESVELQIVTDTGNTTRYELWDGAWSDWSAFLGGIERPALRAATMPQIDGLDD